MKTHIVAISIFCLSFLCIVSIGFADEVTCNPDGTQMELNVCAQQAFRKQDGELNRLYKEQMVKLKTPLVQNRFKKSQQAWVKFRDTSCLYEVGSRAESGSIWPLLNLNCMAALTEERVKRLQTYVSCTDDGCPK